MKKIVWRFIALLVVTVAVIALWSVCLTPHYRLSINVTDSLPHRFYLIRLQMPVPEYGVLLLFRPPPNRYYPADARFLKRVNGIAGDCVRYVWREGRRAWLINGRFQGWLKPTAADGRSLRPGPVGRIPVGYVSVYTPNEHSYDSRYADIGWVSLRRVVGHARPLFGHRKSQAGYGCSRTPVRDSRGRSAAAYAGTDDRSCR